MGCSFSGDAPQPFDCVRVVHINGHVEDFHWPVTVGQVTGKPIRHVLCSAAQLLSAGPGLFRPDERLEPGRVYFLLPHAVLASESDPVQLACLISRLTLRANRTEPSPVEPVLARFGGNGPGRSSHTWRPQLERIEEPSFEMERTP